MYHSTKASKFSLKLDSEGEKIVKWVCGYGIIEKGHSWKEGMRDASISSEGK